MKRYFQIALLITCFTVYTPIDLSGNESNNKYWIDITGIDNLIPIYKIAWSEDSVFYGDYWFSEKSGLITDGMTWMQGSDLKYGRFTFHRFNRSQYTCNFNDSYNGCDNDCFGANVRHGIAVRDENRNSLPLINLDNTLYYLLDLSAWENWCPVYLPYSREFIQREFKKGLIKVFIELASNDGMSHKGSSEDSLKEKYESQVVFLCGFIPDHGLRTDAKAHMTASYYDAYSDAINLPTASGDIGEEEFLYYFVSGQDDTAPIFSVNSIKQDGDILIASISIALGNNETSHTLRLKKDKYSSEDKYLIDDFDDTKRWCLDYVKRMQSNHESWQAETKIIDGETNSLSVDNVMSAADLLEGREVAESNKDWEWVLLGFAIIVFLTFIIIGLSHRSQKHHALIEQQSPKGLNNNAGVKENDSRNLHKIKDANEGTILDEPQNDKPLKQQHCIDSEEDRRMKYSQASAAITHSAIQKSVGASWLFRTWSSQKYLMAAYKLEEKYPHFQRSINSTLAYTLGAVSFCVSVFCYVFPFVTNSSWWLLALGVVMMSFSISLFLHKTKGWEQQEGATLATILLYAGHIILKVLAASIAIIYLIYEIVGDNSSSSPSSTPSGYDSATKDVSLSSKKSIEPQRTKTIYTVTYSYPSGSATIRETHYFRYDHNPTAEDVKETIKSMGWDIDVSTVTVEDIKFGHNIRP